jgi:hypothetical protein
VVRFPAIVRFSRSMTFHHESQSQRERDPCTGARKNRNRRTIPLRARLSPAAKIPFQTRRGRARAAIERVTDPFRWPRPAASYNGRLHYDLIGTRKLTWGPARIALVPSLWVDIGTRFAFPCGMQTWREHATTAISAFSTVRSFRSGHLSQVRVKCSFADCDCSK